MLQTIRERAQGWIAWAIVILISVPFALWGIQSYLGVGSEPVVASVNGVQITERDLDRQFQETRIRLREQLGAAYRPEMFDDKQMRAQVLDRMIRDTLLLQVSEEMGLRASDQELRTAIVSNPSFQREGRFDNATYERALELQGLRPLQFEDSLRQRIVGTQLARAVTSSALVTAAELSEAVRLQQQKRKVSFVRVPKSAFVSGDPIPDEDVLAYYDQNQERFKTPERVKVQYLVLDASMLNVAEKPGEEDLRQVYESEVERFRKPERRQVSHILISVPADADAATEEKAKDRLSEIRARVERGEDFAEVAKTSSEDPGSAGQGGDLGLIEEGLMDPAFDQAAFALEEGAISEPVRSQFGYHLIRVTKIEPAAVKPFEDVRDQLEEEAAKRGAEGAFFDWAERLANLAYENPDTLAPAAEALELELKTSDWIDRRGGEGLLANPKVVGAAFSDDVLKEGLNSELIEPEPNVLQAIVLRVVEHEEASTKPLDQVREEIVSTLRDQRAAEAAQSAADGMVKQLESGTALKDIAGKYEVTQSGLVARDAPDVPPGVLNLAFTLPRPGQGAASFGSQALENGDAAVVVVSEIVDGSSAELDQAAVKQERDKIRQTVGRTYYDELLTDLEARAQIERKKLEQASVE